MSQAERESTFTEMDLRREDAENLNPLIGEHAGETMTNCADLAKFIGYAAATIEADAGVIPGATVRHALMTVALALEYEAFLRANPKPGEGAPQ